MISRQNKHVIGIEAFHISKVLIDRVCSTGVPLRMADLLIRRENRNTAHILIKIPRNPDTNMRIESKRHILRKNADRIHT